MDFSVLAKERFSVRKFDASRAVEEEKVAAILEAARVAPTAHNNQPHHVWVCRSEKALETIRPLTPCHYNAPVVFVVGYDDTVSWKREEDGKDHGEIDAAIALTQMTLAAADVGLGSCIVGMFDETAVRNALGLAENFHITMLLPVGYLREDAKPAHLHGKRREMSEMAHEV